MTLVNGQFLCVFFGTLCFIIIFAFPFTYATGKLTEKRLGSEADMERGEIASSPSREMTVTFTSYLGGCEVCLVGGEEPSGECTGTTFALDKFCFVPNVAYLCGFIFLCFGWMIFAHSKHPETPESTKKKARLFYAFFLCLGSLVMGYSLCSWFVDCKDFCADDYYTTTRVFSETVKPGLYWGFFLVWFFILLHFLLSLVFLWKECCEEKEDGREEV